jgi:hypothetical protein
MHKTCTFDVLEKVRNAFLIGSQLHNWTFHTNALITFTFTFTHCKKFYSVLSNAQSFVSLIPINNGCLLLTHRF